jgi:hypothetical protein
MGSYKCSSCGSLIFNGSLHGCYDVSNRRQPNDAARVPVGSVVPGGNSDMNYPGFLPAAQAVLGQGPSGSTATANEEDALQAAAVGVALGRYPQPGGAGPASLVYEPYPSETVAEAASQTYNGISKGIPIAYTTESGFVTGQAPGGMF